jgi:hypothetical protein
MRQGSRNAVLEQGDLPTTVWLLRYDDPIRIRLSVS